MRQQSNAIMQQVKEFSTSKLEIFSNLQAFHAIRCGHDETFAKVFDPQSRQEIEDASAPKSAGSEPNSDLCSPALSCVVFSYPILTVSVC